MIGRLGDPMLAMGIETPFQNVAIDDERAWKRAVSLALFERTDVDNQRPGGSLGLQGLRRYSIKTGTSRVEHLADRPLLHHERACASSVAVRQRAGITLIE